MIAFLGAYPPPFGGISSHLSGLIPDLQADGIRCGVVAPGQESGLERKGDLLIQRVAKTKAAAIKSLLSRPGSTVADLVKLGGNPAELAEAAYIARALDDLVEAAGEPPKLISAYHIFPWGIAALLASKRYGVPYTLTNFGELYAQPDRYLKQKDLVERIVQSASGLMASSRHCARSYADIGVDAEVHAIPYGVDTEHFADRGQGAAIREEQGVPPEDLVVLFVGRYIPDMGAGTFMETVESLLTDEARGAGMRFWMAGAEGELYPQAEKLAARAGDRMHIEKNVPFPRLPDIYAAADVVVAPTSDNRACMGLAIKEAMAVGRAVIATSVGGIPEAIVDGEHGLLVDAGDSAGIAERLVRLRDDREMLERLRDAGHRRGLEEFALATTHRRVRAVFDRALGEG